MSNRKFFLSDKKFIGSFKEINTHLQNVDKSHLTPKMELRPRRPLSSITFLFDILLFLTARSSAQVSTPRPYFGL
jgi:hypothetical protein